VSDSAYNCRQLYLLDLFVEIFKRRNLVMTLMCEVGAHKDINKIVHLLIFKVGWVIIFMRLWREAQR